MNTDTLKSALLLISFPLLFSCGSRSADFNSASVSGNPLPPCPDSPNCVRVTEVVPFPLDTAWERVLETVNKMKPVETELDPDEYRGNSVFQVVFFRDDLVFQLEEAGQDSTRLHLRSASRTGHTDFGVNRRRVRRFLDLFSRVTGEAETGGG